MKSATTTAILVSAILLATIAMFSPAFAQATQVSYTANLTYSSIQVTYPSEIMPGDVVTVNVQVTPKNNVFLQKLTATVYYPDATGLHQLTSETLADNSNMSSKYSYGYGYSKSYATSSFSKSFQVTVPSDAPRTSLVALFSETAQSSTYSYNYYSGYPYYYYYGYPYSYNYYYGYPYNSTYYNCGHYYCYYSYSYPVYYAYYPSYSYPTMSTDTAIAPLSYIKASTPEYASLQSQYQSLQQQLQQSQAQNQQLQGTVSSQSATISQLNQQLSSSSSTTQTYQGSTIGLGVVAAAFAALAAVFWRRSKPQTAPLKQ